MTDTRTRKEKIENELWEYASISAYLFVCFSVILLYGSAVRGVTSPGLDVLGLAAAKALVLGKFALLGEAAGIGSRVGSRTLGSFIVRKLVLLFLLLLLLTAVEELLLGWLHGRSLADTIGEYQQRSLMEIMTTCVLLFFVLAPYVAATEISRALGPGALKKLLTSPRDK